MSIENLINNETKNNAHRLMGALIRTDDETGLNKLAKILRYNTKQLPKDIVDLKRYINALQDGDKTGIEFTKSEAVCYLTFLEKRISAQRELIKETNDWSNNYSSEDFIECYGKCYLEVNIEQSRTLTEYMKSYQRIARDVGYSDTDIHSVLFAEEK